VIIPDYIGFLPAEYITRKQIANREKSCLNGGNATLETGSNSDVNIGAIFRQSHAIATI